jgi:hypothetical protein
MKRLMGRLPIAGAYAATIDRSGGGAEILCALQRREDADCLAVCVGAVPLENSAGWASVRRFVVDADERERLLDVAGPPIKRRRPPPTESPPA